MKNNAVLVKQFLPNGNAPTTIDYVAIEEIADVRDLSYHQINTNPSDYAIACVESKGELYKNKAFSLRDGNSSWNDLVTVGYAYNSPSQSPLATTTASTDSLNTMICPVLFADLDKLFDTSNTYTPAGNSSFGKYQISKSPENVIKITFDKFVFPQTIVAKDLMEKLTKQLKLGELKKTGRKYIGTFDKPTQTPTFNEEYEYNGERYVAVDVENGRFPQNRDSFDGKDTTLCWFKVEPIAWTIRNYASLPKWLNPDGDGSHKGILLRSEMGIISGIPFSANKGSNYSNYYQNSLLRAFLNGYNTTEKLATDYGNLTYYDKSTYNFDGNGFLDEAFLGDKSLLIETDGTSSSDRPAPAKKKGYGVVVDNAPLSVKEQIQFYLNTGKSFMLHGPSGVGKTRRIQEIDPQCVILQLRNGILPEEIIGKTAFEDKTSKWIEPTWYTKIKEICEKDPEHNHVLFIDELTNVHANEQSLVYHIVLEHSIDGNIGKLPKNCVVVAAGNNPEESEAAYNMPEPLFRRFDAHIQLQPNIESWIEWGSGLNSKGRPKIHPLVADFVATYGDKVFYSKYDPEKPPKFAIDPRGWEQVSNIIYDNNNVLRFKLIEDKVGTDIATSFLAFASQYHLTVEDIVNETYDSSDIPISENQKFALTCSLRRANEEQMPKVRQFIERYFGREKVAIFDKLWIENNDERALFLNDFLEQGEQTQNEIG